MPLRSDIVGERLAPVEMAVTTRMILAYSAGIGERSEAAFDDTRDDFAASPFFCVRPEWQFTIAARTRDLGLSREEAIRGVHAGQRTRFLAPLRPGIRIRVSGAIVAVRQTRAGALSTTKMEVSNVETGEVISSTLSDGMYRGVAVVGGDRAVEGHAASASPPAQLETGVRDTPIALDRWFAHRYTECADIWNPIHSEQQVALAAGLPGSIVHGTALWALAGKTIVEAHASGRRLTSLSGRFTAMVPAGTDIVVRHAPAAGDASSVAFVVLNHKGEQAVSAGLATFAP